MRPFIGNGAPRHNPFPAAFGSTFLMLLMLVFGISGYELHKSDWSIMRVTRSDGPVWWQIYIGLIAAMLAVYFWRKALRLMA